MVYRSFLDNNVFVFGEHVPESNSRLILDNARDSNIEVVISRPLIEEVRTTFSSLHGRGAGINEAHFIASLPYRVEITDEEIKARINEFRNLSVKEFDLLHFIAAKIANSDYFVTTDEDFFNADVAKEIKPIKPKDFVRILGIKPYETDY